MKMIPILTVTPCTPSRFAGGGRAPREDARLVPARHRLHPPGTCTPPHPHPPDTHTPGPIAFCQHSPSSSLQAVERGPSTRSSRQATDRKKLTRPSSSSTRQARARVPHHRHSMLSCKRVWEPPEDAHTCSSPSRACSGRHAIFTNALHPSTPPPPGHAD